MIVLVTFASLAECMTEEMEGKRGLFWRAVSVHHGREVREGNPVNGDESLGGAVLITVDQEADSTVETRGHF